MAALDFSEDADERIKALNDMHAQKVRALMKSINSLKKQVNKLTSEAKGSNRGKAIVALKKQGREFELVIDVLKDMLESMKKPRSEIDAELIRRACGGPKRFRPKIREELEEEVKQLKDKVRVLKNAAAKSKRSGSGSGSGSGSSRRGSRSAASAKEEEDGGNEAKLNLAAEAERHAAESKLIDEAQQLNVQLMAKTQEVEELSDELDELRTENRQLKANEDQARRRSAKYTTLKSTAARLRREHLEMATRVEQLEEELRSAAANEAYLKEEVARLDVNEQDAARAQTREYKELQAKYLEVCTRLDQVSQSHATSATSAVVAAKVMHESSKEFHSTTQGLTEQARDAGSRADMLQRQLDEARDELSKLKVWRDTHEEHKDSSEARMMDEIEELRNENASLKAALTKATEDAVAAAEQAQQRHAALEADAAEATEAMEEARVHANKLQEQVNTLKQKVNASQILMRKTTRQHEKEVARLQRALEGSGASAEVMGSEGRDALSSPTAGDSPRAEAKADADAELEAEVEVEAEAHGGVAGAGGVAAAEASAHMDGDEDDDGHDDEDAGGVDAEEGEAGWAASDSDDDLAGSLGDSSGSEGDLTDDDALTEDDDDDAGEADDEERVQQERRAKRGHPAARKSSSRGRHT